MIYKTSYEIARMSDDLEYIIWYESSESYSKYYQRRAQYDTDWQKAYDNKTEYPKWNVYGWNQIQEHLQELRAQHPDYIYRIVKTVKTILD